MRSSYAGAMAAFIFVTLSLGMYSTVYALHDTDAVCAASGLLWLSELIEEHSRMAKSIGQRGIYVRILYPFSLAL